MSNYAIIRLGKDSVADIRTIDALHESPAAPINFTVHCKQVPTELMVGDYAFLCFGSDNSQGAPTDWVRGVRALGTIARKEGGPGYNDPWHVLIEIKVILPQSVVRRDLLAHAPTAYFWCSGVPTIGIEANSQQTIQMIKDKEADQSVPALAYALAAHSPSFRTDVIKAYPELKKLFDYEPDLPIGPSKTVTTIGSLSPEEIQELLKSLIVDTKAAGFRFPPRLFHSVSASLMSKKFLILTGLAGSGKTKLAQALAHWATTSIADTKPPTSHYTIVPVGADWTGNDHILGYADGLREKNYVLKPALELIITANAPENKHKPHFLILDEMNLSHVERYFADILSAIESGEPIPLHEGSDWTVGEITVPPRLSLPSNLFIIGTVNVDETTYMFSPKVLDRANVIEFRMDPTEIASFLDEPKSVHLDQLDGKGQSFAKAFVDAAGDKTREVPASVKALFKQEMLLFFNLLQEHQAEFGYRTSYEAGRFLHFYKELGGFADADAAWFNEAMDAVIVQKLLPKLHGSRPKLESLLWALANACGADRGTLDAEGVLKLCKSAGKAEDEAKYSPESVNAALETQKAKARFPLSFDKVLRMYRKLVRDQFVTFSEA